MDAAGSIAWRAEELVERESAGEGQRGTQIGESLYVCLCACDREEEREREQERGRADGVVEKRGSKREEERRGILDTRGGWLRGERKTGDKG